MNTKLTKIFNAQWASKMCIDDGNKSPSFISVYTKMIAFLQREKDEFQECINYYNTSFSIIAGQFVKSKFVYFSGFSRFPDLSSFKSEKDHDIAVSAWEQEQDNIANTGEYLKQSLMRQLLKSQLNSSLDYKQLPHDVLLSSIPSKNISRIHNFINFG